MAVQWFAQLFGCFATVSVTLFWAGLAEAQENDGQSDSLPNQPSVKSSLGFRKAVSAIEGYRDEHGVAPSYDFFFSLAENGQITSVEQTRLWHLTVAQQQPSISLSDLLALLEAKRDSIQSFRCKYKTSKQPGEVSFFAFDGNKALLREAGPRTQIAFDGKLVRTVRLNGSAAIEPLQSLDMFYRAEMPLAKAMLLDPRIVGVEDSGVDLSLFLRKSNFAVFEEVVDIDDSRCVLVATYPYKAYLDLDRNFALKKLESIKHESVPDSDGFPVVTRHSVKAHSIHSGFIDYGNGIWLPTKIVTEHPNGATTVIEVVEAEVNPEIADADFVDIISDDAKVLDVVRGLTYVWGERSSIDHALVDAAPPKKQPSAGNNLAWWVSITIFLVAIGIYMWK